MSKTFKLIIALIFTTYNFSFVFCQFYSEPRFTFRLRKSGTRPRSFKSYWPRKAFESSDRKALDISDIYTEKFLKQVESQIKPKPGALQWQAAVDTRPRKKDKFPETAQKSRQEKDVDMLRSELSSTVLEEPTKMQKQKEIQQLKEEIRKEKQNKEDRKKKQEQLSNEIPGASEESKLKELKSEQIRNLRYQYPKSTRSTVVAQNNLLRGGNRHHSKSVSRQKGHDNNQCVKKCYTPKCEVECLGRQGSAACSANKCKASDQHRNRQKLINNPNQNFNTYSTHMHGTADFFLPYDVNPLETSGSDSAAVCKGKKCQGKCLKDDCIAACEGDACSVTCEGNICHAVSEGRGTRSTCEGNNCVAYGKGPETKPKCTGSVCQTWCVGDHCIAKCYGFHCEAMCSGHKCKAQCVGKNCTQFMNPGKPPGPWVVDSKKEDSKSQEISISDESGGKSNLQTKPYKDDDDSDGYYGNKKHVKDTINGINDNVQNNYEGFNDNIGNSGPIPYLPVPNYKMANENVTIDYSLDMQINKRLTDFLKTKILQLKGFSLLRYLPNLIL